MKYGTKFFDEHSLNSIVLEREKGVFVYYNIEDSNQEIPYWINKMSLKKSGDDYNRETTLISKLLFETEALLYVKKENSKHLSDEGADSRIAMSVIERIAPNYFEKINFFFVEKPDFTKDKARYGIHWDHYPAFTLVSAGKNYFPLPIETQFSNAAKLEKTIEGHLMDHFKGRLKMPDRSMQKEIWD